jgi:hypothetical protein
MPPIQAYSGKGSGRLPLASSYGRLWLDGHVLREFRMAPAFPCLESCRRPPGVFRLLEVDDGHPPPLYRLHVVRFSAMFSHGESSPIPLVVFQGDATIVQRLVPKQGNEGAIRQGRLRYLQRAMPHPHGLRGPKG